MRVRTLHERLGVGDHLRLGKVGREFCRAGIHQPADPEGPVLKVDQHHLGGIEGPGIIAAEPVDVCRIADDHRIETAVLHRLSYLCQPRVIFGLAECRCHDLSPCPDR